jgi:hypothetical protein
MHSCLFVFHRINPLTRQKLQVKLGGLQMEPIPDPCCHSVYIVLLRSCIGGCFNKVMNGPTSLGMLEQENAGLTKDLWPAPNSRQHCLKTFRDNVGINTNNWLRLGSEASDMNYDTLWNKMEHTTNKKSMPMAVRKNIFYLATRTMVPLSKLREKVDVLDACKKPEDLSPLEQNLIQIQEVCCEQDVPDHTLATFTLAS